MDNKTITFDQFKNLEIKIGQILSAEKIDGSEKLLKLKVDFGEDNPRQIISGISKYFPDPSRLVGKKCAFATNLEPRTIFGLQSQGMILAVSGTKSAGSVSEESPSAQPTENISEGEYFSLLETSTEVSPGAEVK